MGRSFCCIVVIIFFLNSCHKSYVGSIAIFNADPDTFFNFFNYYIFPEDIKVETVINNIYYQGNIVPLKDHPTIDALLGIKDRAGYLIECSIKYQKRKLKDGATGTCFHDGLRIFDISIQKASNNSRIIPFRIKEF